MTETPDGLFDHIVSWAEVHRNSKYLVRKLMPHGPWKDVIAVTRGGLVPAAIIAREMDIRIVDTLCITTYDDQLKGTLEVLKVPDQAISEHGKDWLLIDDLVDTGTTAKKALQLLPKAYCPTVYAKLQGLLYVNTYFHDVEQDVWVFFPWDTEPQYIEPLADTSKSTDQKNSPPQP
jgi:xanthine phosphoribosyltransferase